MTEKRSWREMVGGTPARLCVKLASLTDPILGESPRVVDQLACWLSEMDQTTSQRQSPRRHYRQEARRLLIASWQEVGIKVK